MYEAIMLWDKVLSYSQRDELVRNNWSIKETTRLDGELLNEICDMTAEHMNDSDLAKLHQAMILSPRTMYFKRKLDKIEKKTKTQWNKLRKMHTTKTAQAGELLYELDILPRSWGYKNAVIEWDHLSFTVKHLLRASYNPLSNKFEPLERFGTFTKSAD